MDLQYKIQAGAMLHDIGKVLYRAADGRNHSRSGYDFLKDEAGIKDRDILDQVLYHHAALLKGSGIADDSPAYVTYIADNIAAAADRRKKESGDTGFDRQAPLESIFNILNRNRKSMHYCQGTLEDDGSIHIPLSEKISYDENFYKKLQLHLKDVLSGLTDEAVIKESYLNSLLSAMEADLSFIPSSTDKGQLSDVSLYDHVKITAALAGCIYAWTREQNISDYRTVLFDREKEFYGKKVFLLYSMDMSGIQDFIYHQFGTEEVLKNLRARSFYLEILLENLIDELLERLHLSRANLIYSGGGHAWMLLPNTKQAANIIYGFETETNAWLMNTFGTELFMASAGSSCSALDLENKPEGSYRELFRSVSRKISGRKLNRYSADQILALNGMEKAEGPVRIRGRAGDGIRECKICHRSDRLVRDDICSICDGLGRLSKSVLEAGFYAVTSEAAEGRLPVFEGQYLVPAEEEKLRKMIGEDRHYIRSYSKNKMYTGQSYATKLWVADYSSARTLAELADAGSGIRRLGVIRADVDNLGSAFVSGFPEEYQTLSRSASFSRMLSLFFKKNVNDILKNPQYFISETQERRNATVIYAGGDDLFIIGAWKDIIEFSVDLRQKLEAFTEDALKISAGMGLYNEKYPVSYIASKSGELESRSKGLDGKDAVTLFTAGRSQDDADQAGASEYHTYHWKEFTREVLEEKLSLLVRFFGCSEDQERGKAFLYRILELYRHSGERINLARLAYLLARLEPSDKASEEYRNIYDELKHKLYEWHKDPQDRKQFITAVYIYIYMIRDREEE